MPKDMLEHVFNGLDAYLYVIDPETDEILFMNEKMQQDLFFSENPVGQVCWKALHINRTERCDFCRTPEFKENPDAALHWEGFSDMTQLYFRATVRQIAWPGGKRVNLLHLTDVTQEKAAAQMLEQRMQQQELMATISQSFIGTADISSLIYEALEKAGRFMRLSRVSLTRYEREADVISFPNIWYNREHNPPVVDQSADTLAGVKNAYNLTRREAGLYMACPDTSVNEKFRPLAEIGIKAFISVPIYVGGEFWGLLDFHQTTEQRTWTESDIHMARMMCNVISGVLARSNMEEKLMRMSSIVNSSPDIILYINQEGKVEYFNQGAPDALGYTAEEFQNIGVLRHLGPKAYAHFVSQSIPRILREGKLQYELPVKKKNGEEIIASCSFFRTDFENAGIGVIASDITEKKRMERELLAAKEQAEYASRAKGEFLSRMSHEMRTPMNAIIGMANIAKSSTDAERKSYCLEKIGEASNHLLGVINDILDMSKIEANKFELSPSDFDFEKMLMRVVNVAAFRIDEKEQHLTVNIDKNIPYSIISDEQRLAQVLTNLLSNAVKFTPEGGAISLVASQIEEDANGLCTLRIEVRDSGIGISSEQQSRLFRSFEQADGGIARKFGGTGLGLVISRNIVELMGGKIWIESGLGSGSSFIFTIEVKRGERTRENTLDSSLNWKNLHVLAVDDAPEVLEYFQHLAQSLGLTCTIASSGRAACDILASQPDDAFDVIFVDWKMPGMDGIELTRLLKTRFNSKAVIVMISAAEWSGIEAEARAAGVASFVPKPLFASHIVDSINRCLGATRKVEPIKERMDIDLFTGRRILLAEDVDINREIVVALLEHTGIVIDCAENGQQAFDMFNENPNRYDMILMDVHMPEVDGYESTQRIRSLAIPRAASIPIVAMTANVFREDIEQCLAAGMNDHIGKPLDMNDVLAKLKLYLLG